MKHIWSSSLLCSSGKSTEKRLHIRINVKLFMFTLNDFVLSKIQPMWAPHSATHTTIIFINKTNNAKTRQTKNHQDIGQLSKCNRATTCSRVTAANLASSWSAEPKTRQTRHQPDSSKFETRLAGACATQSRCPPATPTENES